MKILVDKMPKTPKECIFSEYYGLDNDKPVFSCKFKSSKKCDVTRCKFLKTLIVR